MSAIKSTDKFSDLLKTSIESETENTIAFSELVCDLLVDADIMDVPISTDFDAKIGNFRYLINFYELESDKPDLVIGSVLYDKSDSSEGMLKSDIDKYFGFLKNFVTNSISSALHKKIKNEDESYSEIADLSQSIYKKSETITRIKLILATNNTYRGKELKPEKFMNKDILFDIWDNKRFNRFLSSGITNPPIEIGFNTYGEPMPFIKAQKTNEIYDSYLTFFNGEVLEKIYNDYGTRLLDRNVRAFLQTRGKINKGIQTTIKDKPEYFLAYNNGLTITCDNIKFETDKEGKESISAIGDFQIVNGGQTTASLWHAKRKFPDIKLSDIQVISKINLLKEKNKVDELVADISLYSNSQNNVNRADPFGNKEYYRTLEKISRSVTTPESVIENPGTSWFYERVRGAYAEEKNRKKNVTETNKFLKDFPTQQRIEKAQGAKLENTWRLLPFFVSKGAQWNFLKHSEFVEAEKIKPDEIYFKRLVAKQILWKRAEKIVSNQKIPGYRANIVTYTLAIIVDLTGNRIDLLKIWNKQYISEKLEECINQLAYRVRDIITNTSGNVTEYCKKETCWKKIRENITKLPHDFDEILEIGLNAVHTPKDYTHTDKNLEFVSDIPAETWKNIASWGKHTGLLENWEKGISMSIGNALGRDGLPSPKQAYRGKQIYQKAIKNGYKP
jgi:hypothetical protein